MDRAEWLEERRKSIGGSDAATIVGMNAYNSLYALWADKTGRLPAKPDNEAMRQGRDLEQYVADRFMEATGKKVRRRTTFFRSEKYPFAHANIDRAVVHERAGLECKTTNVMNLKKFKNGEYPENYYVQCVHYMAVTGWDRWYLACVILGQGFKWFVIERDQAEIDALMEAEKEFWEQYIVPDKEPPVDGTVRTSEALSSVYSNSSGSTINLECQETVQKYFNTKSLIKSYERELDQYRQELQVNLGENECGLCNNYMISWKQQFRRTFDASRFSEKYPEIDLTPFYKVSTFRKFDIKEEKQQ